MLATARHNGGHVWWREQELRMIAEAKAQGRFERISARDGLKQARQEAGLSIEAFATRLGIYPGALLNWESGRKEVPGWVMGRLQRMLTQDAAA
jgi:DNA-binding transcriptional regulator YiaG